MRYLLFIVLAFVITSKVYAQRNSFKANVILLNGKSKSGYITELGDSTLKIAGRTLMEIKVLEIRTIKIRHRHALWKGALIGAGSGAVIGAIIGYTSYTEPYCSSGTLCLDYGPEGEALGGAFLGAGAGALLGLAIGSLSKDFKIEGKVSLYQQHQAKLQAYTYPR